MCPLFGKRALPLVNVPSILQVVFYWVSGVQIGSKIYFWKSLQVYFLDMPLVLKMKLIFLVKTQSSQDFSARSTMAKNEAET